MQGLAFDFHPHAIMPPCDCLPKDRPYLGDHTLFTARVVSLALRDREKLYYIHYEALQKSFYTSRISAVSGAWIC